MPGLGRSCEGPWGGLVRVLGCLFDSFWLSWGVLGHLGVLLWPVFGSFWLSWGVLGPLGAFFWSLFGALGVSWGAFLALRAPVQPKLTKKLDFGGFFVDAFFECVLASFFGGSNPEKSIKTICFSLVFANFHKIDVFKKFKKTLHLGSILGSQNHQKSITNSV